MDRRAELRTQALTLHEMHGDQPCPVCEAGTLDATWHALATQRAVADALDEIKRQRVELRTYARAAAAVTEALHQHPEHAVFADRLDAVADELAAALAALRTEAAAELERRQDVWVPLAEALAAYLVLADRADEAAPRLALVTAARSWLLANVERLRDERFAPFAARTQEIWDALRQESNVDIVGIRLPNPKGNVRAVAFATAVDGTETSGMSVLSTGELHAITLALFLPRATRPDSPFRFVVLDVPIQAMDPSKIDGFVRVLRDIARDRQVVVFSHDDRLPESVRRLAPEAQIVEVRRGAESVVEIDTCSDAASRNLDDAHALISDSTGVPDDLLRQVVPRLCRAAFDAVARDAWFARVCANGVERAEREAIWTKTRNNRARLALALRGDPKGDVASWLNRAISRKRAMNVCGQQAHTGLVGPARNAVEDVTELVDAIRRTR